MDEIGAGHELTFVRLFNDVLRFQGPGEAEPACTGLELVLSIREPVPHKHLVFFYCFCKSACAGGKKQTMVC